jgi:hypothetical protein
MNDACHPMTKSSFETEAVQYSTILMRISILAAFPFPWEGRMDDLNFIIAKRKEGGGVDG